MMNFDKYRNNLPVPRKSNFTEYFYYKKGKLVGKKNGDDGVLQFVDGALSIEGTVLEKSVDEQAFRDALRAYRTETDNLREQFYADLKEDLGIVDNPKADLLVAKAWDLGHSSGFSEVYNYAADLVDLIQ